MHAPAVPYVELNRPARARTQPQQSQNRKSDVVAHDLQAPSAFDQQHSEADMEASRVEIDRTFRPVLTDEQVQQEVAHRLVVDFSHYRSTHKVIARAAGASAKAAENWTAGATAPSLANFLRLLPHSPSLQAMVRKLMGMDSELSPDFQRELNALIQRHIR
jgi:hypothetical protein